MKTISRYESYLFLIDSMCVDYASLDWAMNNSNDATETERKNRNEYKIHDL